MYILLTVTQPMGWFEGYDLLPPPEMFFKRQISSDMLLYTMHFLNFYKYNNAYPPHRK